MRTPGNSESDVPFRDYPVEHIAGMLGWLIGNRLTAFAVRGVEDPKTIQAVARNEAELTDDQETDIRNLAQVYEAVFWRRADSATVFTDVREVLVGSSRELDDRAPIDLFHTGDADRVVAVADKL